MTNLERRLRTEIDQLRAERDAAVINGINRALSIVARFEVPGDQIFDAIQAEIDRRKGTHD